MVSGSYWPFFMKFDGHGGGKEIFESFPQLQTREFHLGMFKRENLAR